MKSIVRLLILFFSINAGAASMSGPRTGHREAMLADGGTTNLCSPGQFALNPAGVHCETPTLVSESFGSTDFSWMQVSLSQGSSFQDVQSSDGKVSPGLSLLSQTFHEKNITYGFWVDINNLELDKQFLFNSGGTNGVISLTSTSTGVRMGGVYAIRTGNYFFGATLYAGQLEKKDIRNDKLRFGTTYVTSFKNINSVEHSLGARLGMTIDNKTWRYSLVGQPRPMHLAGSTRADETTAQTNNVFTETSKKGDLESSLPWILTNGFEVDVGEKRSIFGFDLTVISPSSQRNTIDSTVYTSEPGAVELGLSFQYPWSDRVSILSGARSGKSINEGTFERASTYQAVSFGILRKYQRVEIGTMLSYLGGYEKSYNRDENTTESTTSFSRVDVGFSSRFQY